MRLTKGMDEGPLYTQKSIPLSGRETKEELATKLQALGANLLVEVLEKITTGTAKLRAQPHPDRATYTKKIEKSDGLIDWKKPGHTIVQEIRAYAGWPKSRTLLGGIDMIITEGYSTPGSPEHRVFGNVNTIASDKSLFAVTSGDGSLVWVERLIPIGKKEMSTAEFLRGYGNRFTSVEN
jgi:methionyl-tRNA formyltransferase